MFCYVSFHYPVAILYSLSCFSDPEERPSAAELRRHEYLNLPPGWQFNGFT